MQHVLLLQCCDSLDASGRCTAGDITTLRVLLHKLHTLTHLLPVGLARACALDGVLWGHVELLAALVQDAYMRHHEGVVEVPLMVEGWARDGGRVAAQRDVFGVGTEQGGAVQVCAGGGLGVLYGCLGVLYGCVYGDVACGDVSSLSCMPRACVLPHQTHTLHTLHRHG